MYSPYQQTYPQMWPSYSQFQPQPPQPAYQQPGEPGQIDGVRWASTMDEVNGTTLGFGQSALFMFTGEDAFAIKSVSSSGVPQVKVFDFALREPAKAESYVTREEFEKLKEQINAKPAVQQADPGPWVGAAQHHADDPVVPGDTPAGPAAVLQPGGPNGMDPVAAQQLP